MKLNLRKFWPLAVLFLSIAALIAACGSSGGGSLNVTVTVTEFKFDPSTITASPGQTVNITLKNSGSVEHTFVIKETNTTISAPAGQSATGSFKAPAAGTYTILCDVPGHEEAGMKGSLIVK